MNNNGFVIVDGHAEIPTGVNKIGQYAFQWNRNLISVSIPNTVSAIQQFAFECCSSLTSVIIPDSVRTISRKCFRDCSLLEKVVLPNKIKSIEEGTFSGCSSLKEIIIPDGVTSIGKDAFFNCSSLSTLVIPESVSFIGESAFAGCQSLKTLTLPKVMTSLGDHAFDGCEALEKIDIPEGITSIGPWVFNNCTSIRVHLPSTLKVFQPLKTYHHSWYNNQINFKELTVSPDNPVLSIEGNCLVDKQKRELLHIMNEATEFPENIESINITDCFLPHILDVEELKIPEGITHISALPFKLMNKLKKLVLPSTLRRFDDGFLNDYPLSSISVTPELLLSDAFMPWKLFCRADLVGIYSVSDGLKKMIATKFRVTQWTEWILSVYFGDQLIYPPANVIKAREEQLARQAEEEAMRKQQEEAENNKRVLLQSLCDATFSSSGFKYSYYSSNKVSVKLWGNLGIDCYLQEETARDDLAFLLDVATHYRNALNPYVSSAPNVCLEWDNDICLYREGMKFIIGKPFPDVSIFLGVDKESAESAFLALENLEKAYIQMSQKYGDRIDRIGFDRLYF